MSRSLVLNASYEPLGAVAARRAVVLVLGGKADTVHATGLALHAERIAVDIPSVVRLRQYVTVPYRRRVAVSRRAVMARDDHHCQYCGGRADSIDHVLPRSKGGTHAWDNVVAACRPCNVRKRDRTPIESGMRLRRSPSVPHGIIWSIVAGGRVPEEWLPYLAEPGIALPAAAG
jgi:5-methylcytosine-specific restriction endonuclease McrA